MRVTVVAILSMMLSAFAGRGQDEADSAMIQLSVSAYKLSTQKPDSALMLSDRAFIQYQRSGSIHLGAFVYKARGWAYLHQGNYDSAFANLRRSAGMFRSSRDTLELMRTYLDLAMAYSNHSQFATSTAFVLQADTLAEGLNDLKVKASIKRQMGILYREQKQYPKAIGYFKSSIADSRLLKDTVSYIGSVASLSILFIADKRPDSSLVWLNAALPWVVALKGYDYEHALFRERLGDAYFELHVYDKAFQNYKEAYGLFQRNAAKADQAYEALNLGKTLEKQGKGAEAKSYLLESYRLNDSLRLPSYAHDAASQLAGLYTSIGNWREAYRWLATTRQLQDTLDVIQQNEKTLEMQSKYEAEKKDKEIALLKKDQDVRAAELTRERTIKGSVLILSGLLVVIGLLVANRYRLVQRSRRLVEIEKLRNNIARDLHDDIGSALSSIHINSSMALEHPQQEMVRPQLEKIRHHSGRLMESMEDIVWAINPANDNMENLIVRMKEFLAEMLEPLQVQYTLTGGEEMASLRFDIGRRKEIYLVFKEAINNAAKYSRCRRVVVLIERAERELLLTIRDDGQGFDADAVRGGNGLRNMHKRAAAIGGRLVVAGAPGEGTTVTLYIPIT